jgi:hypothetical protein
MYHILQHVQLHEDMKIKYCTRSSQSSGTLRPAMASAWDIALAVTATAFAVFSTLASASSPSPPKRTLAL